MSDQLDQSCLRTFEFVTIDRWVLDSSISTVYERRCWLVEDCSRKSGRIFFALVLLEYCDEPTLCVDRCVQGVEEGGRFGGGC